MTSTHTDPQAPSALHAQPALETGKYGFALGWLYTTRDVLFSPKRFCAGLGSGPLALPFAFAALSLLLPLLVVDFGGYVLGISGPSQALSVVSSFRSLLGSLFTAAALTSVYGLLWGATTRLLGARAPLRTSLRAMAYLTSIGTTFGLPITIAGFAPESAFCVILWFTSAIAAYVVVSYAFYVLARGTYGLGWVKAGFAVWLHQVACGIIGILLTALYSAVQ